MIRWPWVSRLALDMVIDERDRLREQNSELSDQLIRMTRRSNNMSEVTPKVDKPKGRDPIPPEVREVIDVWDSPATRSLMEARARQIYAEYKSWTVVADRLRAESS